MHNSLPLGEGAPVRTLGRMRVKQGAGMEENNAIRRRSQNLRKNMTKEERRLWYDFLKDYPVQFRRQYSIGPYFVDFYCYKARLVVELDGSQHCEPAAIEYDRVRTLYLEQQGYHVLRLSNRDIMEQFRSACEVIDTTVRNRVRG